MLKHTRRILPLMRDITMTLRWDQSIRLRTRRTKYRTTHTVSLIVWEMDGNGERRDPIMIATIASWCPTTGEMFVDDGDRVSFGDYDHTRNVCRANRAELDALADYARDNGHVVELPTGVPLVTRPRHYRITNN